LAGGLFERLKADAGEDWSRYVRHDFVRRLGAGSLPEPAFRHYLVQDYLFLIQFARANALGVYKAPTLADMRRMQRSLSAILDVEMDLHVRFCAGWGISAADLEAAEEHPATTAYTRLVLDSGMRGDLLDLTVALSPCVVGYGEIGRELGAAQAAGSNNPYADWINEYAGDAYQQVAQRAAGHIDELGEAWLTETRYPRLLHLFRRATQLEADFGQMGLDAA
jgi:thiaminase/transcriptional activator TenA